MTKNNKNWSHGSGGKRSKIKVSAGSCSPQSLWGGVILASSSLSCHFHLHRAFTLCVSVSKFPSSYKDTSPIGWDPPWWPHVNLITSAKTLFSNKSHSSVLGLGLHCLCEGHKPVTSLNWVFEIIKEWMWRALCSRGPLIRWRTWTDYCSGVPARLVTLCPLISWFLQPPEKGALVTQKHEHHGWGDAMNGLCLLILLLSYLLKVPSLTTQSLSWNIPELAPTSFPVMRLSLHPNLFSLCPSCHIQDKRGVQVVCLSEEKRCPAEVKAEVTFSGSVFLVWLFLRES